MTPTYLETPEPLISRLSKPRTELHADLLVVGGFGRGPFREVLFGGVTQSIIEHADYPVFIMH